MTRFLPLVLAVPLLAGCATSAEIVTALEPARDMPSEVRCSDPCTDEWQRAQFWAYHLRSAQAPNHDGCRA